MKYIGFIIMESIISVFWFIFLKLREVAFRQPFLSVVCVVY